MLWSRGGFITGEAESTTESPTNLFTSRTLSFETIFDSCRTLKVPFALLARSAWPKSGVALLAATAILTGATTGWADRGTRVHVGGAQVLDLETSRDDGSLVIAGTLRDDTSAALGGGTVHVAVLREGVPDDPETRAAVRAALPCADDTKAVRVGADGSLELGTDESGRFCARVRLLVDRYRIRAKSVALRDLDAAAVDVPLDLARLALHLSFDPKPRIVDLGADRHTIEVLAIAEDGQTAKPAAGRRLALVTEEGAPLGSGVTNASGRVRFDVANERIGTPGRGELRVHFGGDELLSPATAIVLVERHIRVEVALVGTLEARNPEDGLPLELALFGMRGKAGAKPERLEIPSGSIELGAGGVSVGAAPVADGKARVLATFADPGFSPVELSARYTPAAPWFEPGTDARILVPVKGASPFRRAPLALAAILVVLYLVFSRWPLRVRRPEIAAAEDEERQGIVPGIQVVRRLEPHDVGQTGHSGTVIDAHEGSAIAFARVTLERPSFADREVLAAAETDGGGRFELAFVPPHPGDVLRIEAPYHVDHEQVVPPPGELRVALVSRRRALLSRLVRWARRRGAPIDRLRPEPTPSHVARSASGDPAVAAWANATERAAFGPEPVDREREGEVLRLAPEDARND